MYIMVAIVKGVELVFYRLPMKQRGDRGGYIGLRNKHFRRAFRRFEAFFAFERAKIGASAKNCDINVGLAPISRRQKAKNTSTQAKATCIYGEYIMVYIIFLGVVTREVIKK